MSQNSLAVILLLLAAIFVAEFFSNESQFKSFLGMFRNENQQTQVSQNGTSTNTQPTQQIPPPTTHPSAQLVDYALQVINNDRSQNGLSAVSLSDNGAAQLMAEDVLSTKQISHWTTDGEKPYMLYTTYGGTDYVDQNVAIGGYTNASQCSQFFVRCQTIDPMQEINSLENQMVYNDSAENWGHRDNILNPYHTNVSIGIAYDNYFFVMVQNFENDYIQMQPPVTTDGQHVRISGTLSQGNIIEVLIYYDPYPTSALYQEHAADSNYTLGKLLGGAISPDSTFSDPSLVKLNPSVWMPNNNPVANVSFDMAQLENSPGVYTLVTWIRAKDYIPITSYSVFIR